LRREFGAYSLEELQEKLESLDKKVFEFMNESDRKNKRRIVRKIEIAGSKYQVSSSKYQVSKEYKNLIIGLELPKEKLKKNIDKRVDERIKNGGIKEAKNLFKDYKNLTQQVKDANGYRQLFEHFLGLTSLKQAIEKWKISEYHHAKNQMTWFKKDKRIIWFEADKKGLFEAVGKEIDLFLSG
jgi:tRNA dimethylallyltransferase